MKHKNLVLFDVGGVLLELNYTEIYKKGAELTGKTHQEFKIQYSELETNALNGKISNQDYQTSIKNMLGNPEMSRTELEKFVSNCWGNQIDDVVDLKQRVYFNGTPVGIFSNINQFAWEYLSKAHPKMFQTFNPQAPVICSYISKAVKPSFPMYQDAEKYAEENGFKQITLIEDKESYLNIGMEEYGWNGVLFTQYIDEAEAIRSVKGHNDKERDNKIVIANSVGELEKCLNCFGIKS